MNVSLRIKENNSNVKKLNIIIHYFICSKFSIIYKQLNIKRLINIVDLIYDMRCKLTLKIFKIVIFRSLFKCFLKLKNNKYLK